MQFFTAVEQWQHSRLNRHDGFAYSSEMRAPVRAFVTAGLLGDRSHDATCIRDRGLRSRYGL